MKTPIVIDGTAWSVSEILPISILGPLSSIKLGSVKVTHSGNEHPRRFNWKAQRVENHWRVMGDGAVMPSGSRIKNTEQYPFMTDELFNLRLSRVISDFLDEELNVTSFEPKPVEVAAPFTVVPLPPCGPEAVLNSGEPASLSAKVVAKVCETEGMTIEDVRDSKNRGRHSRARQIIVYLLRELKQKNSVILAAIGASETATSLVYVGYSKIEELLTDNEFRLKVSALRKEFGLSALGEEAGTAAEQSPVEGGLIVSTNSSSNGNVNGSVGRITRLVSEIVCAPVLTGTESSMLDLGPARIARTYLLFDMDKDMTPEKISVGTGLDINVVNSQIVEALLKLRQSESEVSKIVTQVKKRLASEAVS